jgi:two-component system phosphate regulon sensor histidine kinase PhoR
VSHELRTPLTVISGFVETLLLNADELTPQHSRALKLIHQQSQRMEVIISDLLALSRLEMEEDNPPQEPVQIPQLLVAIVDEARTLSGSEQHVFELDIDQSLGMTGDKKELYSLFSNLIFNAVRHTSEGTQIGIHWRRILGRLEFSVTDTGEGIPAQHIPRLTERFYRVDTSRSRESGGTGLGLAIVKHVLNRHGGELLITSEVGRGSSFTCLFPSARAIYKQGQIEVSG